MVINKKLISIYLILTLSYLHGPPICANAQLTSWQRLMNMLQITTTTTTTTLKTTTLSPAQILLQKIASTTTPSKIFLCYWYNDPATSSNTNPSACTHITFAFFDISSNGDITPQGDTSTFLALKNSQPNAKLLISIGGWNPDIANPAFEAVAASPTKRQYFASKILTYIQINKLHGVDIDWEFPENKIADFTALLQVIFNLLNPRGYLVTIAVSADIESAKISYDFINVVKNVHYINLMTYDFHGEWESVTGLHSALYSPSDLSVDKATQFWISQIGASNKNKLLLGIPLYGKGWTLSSSNTGIGAMAQSGFDMNYNEICLNIKMKGWTRVFDTTQRTPFVYGGGRWIGYDDAQSIQEKINYLNANGLGGAFIWEMTGDDSTGACGAGTFPLTNLIKSLLKVTSLVTTKSPGTTAPTNPPITLATTKPTQNSATTQSSGPFVCPSAGLFKNPSDCSTFYNCAYAGFSTVASACNPGLLWNDAIKACDWTSVGCNAAPAVTTTIAPVIDSQCGDTLKINQCLYAGGIIYSCNGCFQFTLQVDGNIVIYKNTEPKQVVWSPNIYGKGVVKICMLTDGNLVASTSNDFAVWASNTNANAYKSNAIARIQNDGQFVVSYDGQGKFTSNVISSCPAVIVPPVTATTTPKTTTTIAPVTDSQCNNMLKAPQCMFAGEIRNSCNGCFQFTLQVDGNLVVYKNSQQKPSIWSPNIYGKGVVKTCMQDDGNLVAYTSSMTPIWASNTYASGAYKPDSIATMQDDGQLVVSYDGQVKFSTNSISSCPTDASPVITTKAPVSTTSKVFLCYWPSWSSVLVNTNPSLCTHVSFAFFDVFANGNINAQNNAASFLALKSSHPNTKLLISLGGGTYGPDSAFSTIAASADLRQTLASNILSYVQTNNLHGVDIDWEFPNNQAANFVLLLQAIYNALHPNGYLVTIAVAVDNSLAASRYDIPNVEKYVDFINLMTYDYHGSWESSIGINAPLYGTQTWDIYTVDVTTQYWIARMSSRSKLLLGIPFYGPSWTLSSGDTSVGASGTAGASMQYREICNNIKNNGWTRVFDNVRRVPYAYGGNRWVGYDDAQSIQEKIVYLNANGLGGAFIWEITGDDFAGYCGAGQNPLMSLIRNSLQ